MHLKIWRLSSWAYSNHRNPLEAEFSLTCNSREVRVIPTMRRTPHAFAGLTIERVMWEEIWVAFKNREPLQADI